MKRDLQDKADSPLIETTGECSQAFLNLALFGVATPYLHNGTLTIEDDNGEVISTLFDCILIPSHYGGRALKS